MSNETIGHLTEKEIPVANTYIKKKNSTDN